MMDYGKDIKRRVKKDIKRQAEDTEDTDEREDKMARRISTSKRGRRIHSPK